MAIDPNNAADDIGKLNYGGNTFPFFRTRGRVGEFYGNLSVDDNIGFMITTDLTGSQVIVSDRNGKSLVST
ncbi:MAG: hypothetical protein EOO68_30350 [Moraxellaceae bacterium]|nr:MAG: hypothetical protein EOO68_30350 [Moraxellaceae bacterium]